MEVRRLRAGVFCLGSYLGLDSQKVVQFSEAISGKKWMRCGSAELEVVVADLAQIAGRMATGITAIRVTDASGGPGRR
jgi:hypothetical protein